MRSSYANETVLKALACAAGLLLAAVTLTPAAAQVPAAPTLLSDASRTEVIARAAESLRTRYVVPEAGEAAAKKIEAQLDAGAYQHLEARAFAEGLTADLQSVTKDKHLRVFAPGPIAPQPNAATAAPPPANEGGFVRADRLQGNIGYVEVSGFAQPGAFKPAADRAMAALGGTTALVIDIRRNGGGTPDAVAYLLSFFLERTQSPVLLNEFISRVPGKNEFTTDQVFSVETPTSYVGKPVYVLTSAQTFSGGEGFAYAMQAFKLATVVGEVTGGGGHLGDVAPIGSGFGIFVPYGRPINPVTKTGWEGIGVIPEIKTTQADALRSAMSSMGQKVSATDVGTLSEARLFAPRSTPLPGTEAMLRKLLSQLVVGAPDYALLSQGLANATRRQLPMMQGRLSALGTIKSVTFVGVAEFGGDSFDVEFDSGAMRWSLSLSADGKKIQGALFGPVPLTR